MPTLLLRLEGAVTLLTATLAYFYLEGGWLLFLLLLFVPDLGMIGYAAGVRAGSATYNLFHTYSLPLLLLAGGVVFTWHLVTLCALIWLAHIGLDRMLGYGLKYPTHFQDTHLQHT